MSENIIVPALGESVSEATIAKWYKKEGDNVELDELILELETEKVTLEINASVAGTIEKITKQENETVSVGDILGSISTENIKAVDKNMDKSNIDTNKNVDKFVQNQEEDKKLLNSAAFSSDLNNKNDQSNMPPSVRKLIAENNINSLDISGSGKDGRINKGDVLNFLANKDAASQGNNTVNNNNTQNYSQNYPQNDKPVEIVRMSRLRKTIAQRLKDSQNTAAILTTFNEIDMSSVIAMRKKYKENFQKKHNVKLGFMSFFIKAVVSALKEIPSVNAEIDGEDIIYKKYYDIGVAVGTEQGLVVPVVREADKLSFAQTEQKIVDLAEAARSGKLAMSDLLGGTFSITNGGVYGSLLSTPIINPPQTGIIGLHNTQERAVVIDGKIEVRPMMYVALSYDHRIIDGKDAVTFLVKVKQMIEDPERLILEL